MSRPVHPAAQSDEALLAQVEERRTKASGPGGQRRNKVQTAVQLTHRPSGLVAAAAERRSLTDNRAAALRRLRRALALELRLPADPAVHEPGPVWRRRTAGAGLAVNPRHEDVPALVAEALDVLAACDDDLPRAAQVLGVSSSRLVKVLKLLPAALGALNERQRARGGATWR